MTETDNEIIVNHSEKLTLGSLYSHAYDIQRKCQDYNITDASSNVRMYSDTTLAFKDDLGRRMACFLTPYALSQLCTKLEIPSRYISHKCIATGRLDLAADNINSWISDYDNNLFIRLYDNKVRGVLSDRFSALDAPEIIATMLQAIPKDHILRGHFLNYERLHARLTFKDKIPVDNEDLFPGLQIDSSDVGRSLLKVKFMVYKQVCTNGLTLPIDDTILFKQKHVGISHDEFQEELVKNLTRIGELTERVAAVVKASQQVGIKTENIKSYFDNVPVEIKSLFKESEKSEEPNKNRAKVIDLMAHKYGNTVWGMVNGFTELAQDFSLETRLTMEDFAGKLLVAA